MMFKKHRKKVQIIVIFVLFIPSELQE